MHLLARSALALSLLAPAALGAGVAPAAAAQPPNVLFGAFGRHEVRAGTDMTVRFQVRNLDEAPLTDVTLGIVLSDQLDLVAVDCGPLGAVLPDGDGCAFAEIPARTLAKVTITVRACCPFGGADDIAVAQGDLVGTGIAAAVWSRISE